MRRPWSEIAAALVASGHAPPEGAPSAVPAEVEVAWYVRALLGIAAWVAALFLGLFAGMAVIADRETGLLVAGAVALGAGIVGLRLATGDFGSQLALAGSLAGQGLLIAGIAVAFDDAWPAAVAAAVMAAALIAIVPRAVHRFLCTWIGVGAMATLVVGERVPAGADLLTLATAALAGWLWLSAPDRLARGQGRDPWAAVAAALSLALLGGLLAAMAVTTLDEGRGVRHLGPVLPGPLASVGLGLLLVALSLRIRAELGAGRPSLPAAAGIAALALLGVVTPGSPGLPAAGGVLLLAFHRRSPVLLGAAVCFLVAFLGLHYYGLEASLLTKSLYLLVTGGALVLAAAGLARGQGASSP